MVSQPDIINNNLFVLLKCGFYVDGKHWLCVGGQGDGETEKTSPKDVFRFYLSQNRTVKMSFHENLG